MDQKPCLTCPEPEILCWKKGTGSGWKPFLSTNGNTSRAVLPTDDFDVCIIKAQAQLIRECPTCKDRFRESFMIPDLWWKRYCRDSNGYFGHETTLDEQGHTAALNTWARFPVKLTNKEHLGYEWFKLNVFTRWISKTGQTILIIFDLKDPAASCMERIPKDELDPLTTVPDENYFMDPYWIYIQLLEKVVTFQDAAVWAVRDTVRTTEKTRDKVSVSGTSMPKPTPDYRHLHETARHAIHVSETLDLAVTSAKKILAQHECHKTRPGEAQPDVAWLKAWNHTHERLQYYDEMLSSLQDRSASNKARHFNEINFAYNVVAQFDSGISVEIGQATRRDSEAMKTVAFLTLLFLPATFVSAVFSTSFFDYDAESGSWGVSDKFWVFWVVAIPITFATAVLWYYRHGLSLSKVFAIFERGDARRGRIHTDIEGGYNEGFAAFRGEVRKRGL
ncbi:hypothetical protein CCHL11_02810 [Colletotrichum chlorophyti]|uniref:Magnesium transport protein CorA n=1 Tax=Colletotrichum chlorophyti TaxID=708187 RepID=A0A1Q8S124_9PEZI|nr:hypothetical protein CCHL11_02810 [Colletotrichum chlorophyti]